MTDLKWLYNLVEALDELVDAAHNIIDPDPDDLADELRYNAILNRLQDAVSRANEAGSDVPNIADWIANEKSHALEVLRDEVPQLANLAAMIDPVLTSQLMEAVYGVIGEDSP